MPRNAFIIVISNDRRIKCGWVLPGVQRDRNLQEGVHAPLRLRVQSSHCPHPLRYSCPHSGFYFLLFAIAELITNYSQNTYEISMTCNDTLCQATTDSISFADSQRVYLYLVNPDLNQNDIAFTAYQS